MQGDCQSLRCFGGIVLAAWCWRCKNRQFAMANCNRAKDWVGCRKKGENFYNLMNSQALFFSPVGVEQHCAALRDSAIGKLERSTANKKGGLWRK